MAEKTCKICGKVNHRAAKFCGGCGSRFPKDAAEKLVESDFSALFKVAEEAPATEESDLFQIQVKQSSNEQPPDKDVHMGAEELEKLFESDGTAGEAELENLFGDMSAPEVEKKSSPADGEDGLDEAFNKLLEQREAEEQTVSPLDLSSPSAALLEGDDVLAEARREISGGQEQLLPNSSDDIASLLEEAQKEPATVEPEDATPPQEEPETPAEEPQEEPPAEDEEAEQPRQRRSRRSQPRQGGRRLPSSLARAKLIPPVTFISRLASTLTFIGLSLAIGLGALSKFAPETPSLYVAALPIVGLVVVYIVRRVIKADNMPLPFFNVLLLFVAFLATFEIQGIQLTGWKIFKVEPQTFKPFVMSLVIVAGLNQVLRSRLLHRTFRYILVTVGVYSLTGLIVGITSKLSYSQIIIKRQLEATDKVALVSKLITAFEPTFVAVNFFLPLVVIVLAFEGMRLLMNKFWGHAFVLIITAAFFGCVLFGNVMLYEKANVPNLKSMVRGLQTGRPILEVKVPSE